MYVTVSGTTYEDAVFPAGNWMIVVPSMLHRTPSIALYFWFPLSTVNSVKLMQFENGLVPIDVTDFGIVMDDKLEFAKARLPIVVTIPGILMEVRGHAKNTIWFIAVRQMNSVCRDVFHLSTFRAWVLRISYNDGFCKPVSLFAWSWELSYYWLCSKEWSKLILAE